MRVKMKYILFILFFMGMTSLAWSTNDSIPDANLVDENKVKVIAKYQGDSIVLRWAPTDAGWWYHGIKEGYRISRRTLDSERRIGHQVIVDEIVPWTEQEMENFFLDDTTKKEMIIPLQTIHRDWENTEFRGSLVEIEEKKSLFQQRFQMDLLASDLHPFVATASGLRYVDRDIEPNTQYAYRIEFVRDTTQFDNVIAFTEYYDDRPAIFEAQEEENAIKIRWEKSGKNKKYTSYYIERSEDGEQFERINDLPFTHALGENFASQPFNLFVDSVDNYKPFYYRIIGIDAFGDESTPSNIVLAKGQDRTPPDVDKITTSLDENSGQVTIEWDHQDMAELRQALIYKRDHFDKAKVIYQSESSFSKTISDESVQDGVSDYFLVLIDTAGNIGQSVKSTVYKKDNTPPLAPQGLKSDIDTSGLITLTWEQGPDRDIIGYFLYSADHKGKNFIKLNQEKHPLRVYVDSVNPHQLTQYRYYKVAAIDKGGNIGPYSDVLEVRRPDKVPPAPALFYNYKVDTSGIFLGITPSSSRDVVRHILYRTREDGNREEIRVFTNDMQPIFWDRDLASNTRYTYQLVAEDHSGLQSSTEHSTLVLTSYDTRVTYRPKLSLSATDNGVEISIIDDIPGSDYRIEIFRSINDSKYTPSKYLNGEFEYVDPVPQGDDQKIVKYRARILYRDGKRSKIGGEKSIQY